ncbi:hypothetical protein LTR85_004681 [Meristemomyces frigidus]|nr:hypothetical protein LTR85_004681 [Meristemomyces frigidus]
MLDTSRLRRLLGGIWERAAQLQARAQQASAAPVTDTAVRAMGTAGLDASLTSAPSVATESSAWGSSSAAETSAPAASTTFATSAASSSTSAAAPASTTSAGGTNAGSDSYTMYTGDGTTGAGWPAQSAWVDFDSMFTANLAILKVSCSQFSQPDNSDSENDDLKSAIQSVASTSGVDARFILAIVMQESKGCVRVWTTNYGVQNPGLMQDHDGAGTCNTGTGTAAGTVQNPCPASEITQMITDGTMGTAAGDGLKQVISQAACSDVSQYYKASRLYNSGSMVSGDLGAGIATHCYASDIANRLTGWVSAKTQCTLDG